MNVINHLQTPVDFQGDKLTETLSQHWVKTAPVYFIGLAYPLSFFLSAKWVMMSIGALITVLAGYFAAGQFKKKADLWVGFLTVFVLLYSPVTTLEGNRRSFTGLFLLVLIWIDRYQNRFLVKSLALGLAAGIYPPVALLMLTYFGLAEIHEGINETLRPVQRTQKLFGLLLVFLTMVMPFWYALLFESTAQFGTDWVVTFEYALSSPSEWMRTFFRGSRGAVFKQAFHADLFLIFLVLLMGLIWSNPGKTIFKREFVLITIASLLLWLLAHLAYPLIYQPFKYTRFSLLLAVMYPVLESVPYFMEQIQKSFDFRSLGGIMGWGMVGSGLILWGLYVQVLDQTPLLGDWILMGQSWWAFVFALPFVLSVLFVAPSLIDSNSDTLGYAVLCLLLTLLFFPMERETTDWRGIQLQNFHGMYEFLRTTPPGTTVAGPPHQFMDPIPAYANRPIFSSKNKSFLFPFVCQRTKAFWDVYFRGSPEPIRDFMNERGVDYLLVDRRMVRNKVLSGRFDCMGTIKVEDEPFLNRHFPDAPWSHGRRLYLVGRDMLS
jgi:hypothetical protein